MQTYVERLTAELQRLEGLLAMPRGYVIKEERVTGCWVDITERSRARWTQRADDLRRRLEAERGSSSGPPLIC
jgi:hypothetical protein